MKSDDGVIIRTSYGCKPTIYEWKGNRWVVPSESMDSGVLLLANKDTVYNEAAPGKPIEKHILEQIREDLAEAYCTAKIPFLFDKPKKNYSRLFNDKMVSNDGVTIIKRHNMTRYEWNGSKWLIPCESLSDGTIWLFATMQSIYKDGQFGTPIEETTLHQIREDLLVAFRAAKIPCFLTPLSLEQT
jgi:hypothetical protein